MHHSTPVARLGRPRCLVAVYTEAINHRLLTRYDLRSHLENEGFSERVPIPAGGERMEF